MSTLHSITAFFLSLESYVLFAESELSINRQSKNDSKSFLVNIELMLRAMVLLCFGMRQMVSTFQPD